MKFRQFLLFLVLSLVSLPVYSGPLSTSVQVDPSCVKGQLSFEEGEVVFLAEDLSKPQAVAAKMEEITPLLKAPEAVLEETHKFLQNRQVNSPWMDPANAEKLENLQTRLQRDIEKLNRRIDQAGLGKIEYWIHGGKPGIHALTRKIRFNHHDIEQAVKQIETERDKLFELQDRLREMRDHLSREISTVQAVTQDLNRYLTQPTLTNQQKLDLKQRIGDRLATLERRLLKAQDSVTFMEKGAGIRIKHNIALIDMKGTLEESLSTTALGSRASGLDLTPSTEEREGAEAAVTASPQAKPEAASPFNAISTEWISKVDQMAANGAFSSKTKESAWRNASKNVQWLESPLFRKALADELRALVKANPGLRNAARALSEFDSLSEKQRSDFSEGVLQRVLNAFPSDDKFNRSMDEAQLKAFSKKWKMREIDVISLRARLRYSAEFYFKDWKLALRMTLEKPPQNLLDPKSIRGLPESSHLPERAHGEFAQDNVDKMSLYETVYRLGLVDLRGYSHHGAAHNINRRFSNDLPEKVQLELEAIGNATGLAHLCDQRVRWHTPLRDSFAKEVEKLRNALNQEGFPHPEPAKTLPNPDAQIALHIIETLDLHEFDREKKDLILEQFEQVNRPSNSSASDVRQFLKALVNKGRSDFPNRQDYGMKSLLWREIAEKVHPLDSENALSFVRQIKPNSFLRWEFLNSEKRTAFLESDFETILAIGHIVDKSQGFTPAGAKEIREKLRELMAHATSAANLNGREAGLVSETVHDIARLKLQGPDSLPQAVEQLHDEFAIAEEKLAQEERKLAALNEWLNDARVGRDARSLDDFQFLNSSIKVRFH